MSSQATFAAALLDPEAPAPDGLRSWNGSDPARRFAVYRNNVVSSLIDALADSFPVTQELVGGEFFRAMARLFVQASPPRSPVLAGYGEAFPAFVAAFEPARALPYLADVAWLEWLRVRAFHAGDAEPLAPEVLASALAAPDDLPGLRLCCHPSLDVFASPHAVVSLWAAHHGVGELGDIDPSRPEAALVIRVGLEVEVLRLPPAGEVFVTALTRAEPLGEAATRAAATDDGFDLAANLAILIRCGAFTALERPTRRPA